MADFKLDMDMVGDAIQAEIELWREQASIALSQLKPPALIADNLQLSAAAFLNFGMQIASFVFPVAAGSFKAGCALPLWIVTTAQDDFNRRYTDRLDQANQLLAEGFTEFQLRLIDAVVNAERNFGGTEYARRIQNCIFTLMREDSFYNRLEAKNRIRRLISDAKIIMSTAADVRLLAEQSLGVIGRRLHDILRGTRANNRNATIYVAESMDIPLPRSGLDTASCSIPREVPYQTPKGYRRVTSDSEVAWLLANAHRFEVVHKDFMALEPCHDTTFIMTPPLCGQ